MIVFSDERVEHIANTMFEELIKKGVIKKDTNKSKFVAAVKKGYVKFYRFCEGIEKNVYEKLKSMKNIPQEGSAQYKAMFEKYLLDEWKKY
jgi:hypothetical protein